MAYQSNTQNWTDSAQILARPPQVHSPGQTVVYGGAQTISDAAIVSYQNQPAHRVVIADNPKPQLRFYTSLFVLAIIQIILAALLVIFGLAAFFVGTSDAYDYNYYDYEYDVDFSGVWIGALYIVACSLGLGSLRIRTGYRCLLISYFVLLVIAIVLTPTVIGMSSFWISDGEDQYDEWNYYFSYNPSELALNSVLLIIGIVEMVLSVVSAAFLCCNWHCGECCGICCCGRKTHFVERTQLSTYPKY